ncbi:MAG: hypothetical protein R8G66_08790 [Cytophagales bacterium]|nr:hypothetical protein [Cytophagales bacterium]
MKKLFTEKQTTIAAVIAGPLPAGILIFMNYRALEKDREAIISLAFTLLFSITLFYAIFALPEETIDNIPSFFFTAGYGLLIYLFFRNFMTAAINRELETGAQKRSGWAVAGISLLGLILSLGIMVLLAADEIYYEGELVEYQGNKLYHDAEIPEAVINDFLQQLDQDDFFGEDAANIAHLDLIAGDYFITLLISEENWSDQDIINGVVRLKEQMQLKSETKIHMKLESVSFTGESTFKYID